MGISIADNHPIVIRAKRSNDPHYNDIPLRLWDAVAAGFVHSAQRALKERANGWSLAGGVCIAKEVVRQAVERAQTVSTNA